MGVYCGWGGFYDILSGCLILFEVGVLECCFFLCFVLVGVLFVIKFCILFGIFELLLCE